MSHMVLCEDVDPFMFPCPACASETLHLLFEDFAGIGYRLPFMRRPLFATQRANQVVCCACDTINAQLSDDDSKRLRSGFIPRAIHERFAGVASFYSLDAIRLLQDSPLPEERKRFLIQLSTAYRLEL